MNRIELEWRLIYAIVVAGKSAAFANAAIARLRREVTSLVPPIEAIASSIRFYSKWTWEGLDALARARTGRYKTIRAAILALDALPVLDLETCTPAALELIPGIGPKTARFFVTWTRPTARYAVLDRHVLRWMRSVGYDDAPDSTPRSAREYEDLERAFLEEADRRGKTPRELDLEIWTAAASGPNLTGGER